MLEKGKISSIQMQFMIIPSIIATGVLSIPVMAAKLAGHDMWMTPVFGALFGFITVYIVWKLHQMYPNLTPIQYSEKILGVFLGKVFSFILLYFYLHNTGLVLREYTDFITMNSLRKTPDVVFSISIVFVSAVAVRGGIEVMARSAVICTTIYLLTFIVFLLLIKDIDIRLMLPFLANGLIPVMKGAFVHSTWYSELFLLAFIFPLFSNDKNSMKSGMLSVIFIMFLLLYCNFFVLTMLGDTAANQLYPIYSIIRAISVLNFFENFEAIIMASWVLGNFVKVTLFMYVISLGLAQFLKLSDYRILVFPLGLLIIFFSYWGLPNYVMIMEYMVSIQPIYFILVQIFMPLCLLLVALVRKKRWKWSG